jgi:hypothetical protein
MPVLTHSVAGGRGGEGWKGRLVRTMVAEGNIRKVGTIQVGEEERRRLADSESMRPLANGWTVPACQ